VRFRLGEKAYRDPTVGQLGETDERDLVPTKSGRYPPTDPGVDVRRWFQQVRAHAIETVHEPVKAILEGPGQGPTRGLIAPRRVVLGAVLVYQLALLHRLDTHADRRVGLKPFFQAA
jgi:hypothetical protein